MSYHVLKVRARSEAAVSRRLKARDIESVVPSETITAERRGRKVTEERPLVSRYVFAQGSVAQARAVPGVYDVLRHPTGIPAIVSAAEVAALVAAPQPPAPVGIGRGDQVKITAGPFLGFTGKVRAVKPRKRSATVSVAFFGGPTDVELLTEWLLLIKA